MPTPFDPEEVLARPLMASLATTGPEGPRVTPVWFLWEGAALWMPSGTGASSAGRLAADPRCAVDIVHFDCEAGVLLHLGLRGRAEVLPPDDLRFRRLLARYLGPDEAAWNPWFIAEIAGFGDPEWRWIRLAPASVFTNNVSFFRTGPALVWP